MASRNKVDIRIGGKDYTLVGAESDEYIQKVGLYVDRKMTEITRSNSRLSTAMSAVLTALNVADEYFKAHENELGYKKELKKFMDELEALKEEKRRLQEEMTELKGQNVALQLELAKKETELKEVRNSLDKVGQL